jgi:hypothetical protein
MIIEQAARKDAEEILQLQRISDNLTFIFLKKTVA